MAADRTSIEDDLGNVRLAGHIIPDPASSSGDVPTSQGPGLPALWAPQSGGGGSVASVTAGDASIAVNNADPANPVVEAGTLDQIANLHAPAANWSNNSKKITSIAAATAATDAASLANRLDQFAVPGADVSMNSHKLTSLTNGSGAQDAAAFGQIIPVSIIDAKGDLIVGTANDTAARLAVGSNGQVPTADSSQSGGFKSAYPPGFQFDYVEITSTVTFTATSDGNGGGTAFIDGNAVTYDGSTRVCIEVYVPRFFVNPAIAAHSVYLNLYDGTTDLGRVAQLAGDVASTSQSAVVFARRFLTPSAAAHTFHIRGWKDAAGDSAQGICGAGGASTLVPAYYRITVA